MRIKSIFGLSAAAFGAALALSAPASAAPFLPPANCGTVAGTNCLQFQDFTVYSLALLNFQAQQGPIGPGDQYAVSTNGVALQNALVVGTGVSGAGSINQDLNLPGGVDDAYGTPSAQGGGITNFVPSAGNQGFQGNIPGNTSGTWDIQVSALNAYLNGGSLNFFFNLNQTNSKTTTYLNSPEDALGWMQVTLRNSTTQNSVSFWLDGNACNGQVGVPNSPNCDPTQSVSQNISPGNSDILPNDPLHDEWAYIHGQICISPAGAVVNFGACAKGDKVDSTVNQNLGANDAAFGLYSDALQTALNSGLYDVMSIDFRMAALTNGYEQLLIFAGNAVPHDVPEPLTITMFGAGLAGAALWRRRRKA
jgi:hypothetical protein